MAQESGLSAVLTGVYTALNVAGMTALATGGVYNHVPEGTAYPYVRIGPVSGTRWDRFGADGRRVLFDVHVFSQARGDAEALGIVDMAVELLHYATVTVAGYNAQRPQLEQVIPGGQDEVGGIVTRHWVVSFAVKVTQQ